MNIRKFLGSIAAAAALATVVTPAVQAQDADGVTLADIAERDSDALVAASHYLKEQGLEIVAPVLVAPKSFGANYTTYHFTFAAQKADGTLVEANIRCRSGAECSNWPKSFEVLNGEELKAAADQTLALHKTAEAEFAKNGQTIMSLRDTNGKVANYIVKLSNGTLDLTAVKK